MKKKILVWLLVIAVIITACHVCTDHDCLICSVKAIFTCAALAVVLFVRAVFSKQVPERRAPRRRFALATVRMDL